MDLLILAAPFDTGSFLAGPMQTVCHPTTTETDCRRGRRFFGGISDVGGSSTKPATGPETTGWTLATPGEWLLGGVAVKALAPTAAPGTISGRVLTHSGRGIPRVSITLTGGSGETLNTRTNSFGYYRFEDIGLGNTYILQPESKSYVFAPRVLTINDSVSDLNLYPVGK